MANGRFTPTPLLLPGSIAIYYGDACPSPDLRGVSRPQSLHCDIGAVEYRIGYEFLPLYVPLMIK